MGRRHEQKCHQRHKNGQEAHEKMLHIKCSALPLGKYKSKPQRDTTSHQWEWWKLTRQETTNVGEDVRLGNPLALLVGMWPGTATLENCVEVPQRVKNRATLWPSNFTAGDLPQRYRCSETPGHLHPNVYSSNVHNSQTVEGASVSTERWMDKEDVDYGYNGILLSH